MGIKIGQLRSVVQFKINIPEALGAGFNDSFFDYGQTRGYLKTAGYKNNRVEIAGETEIGNEFELYIRYQPYYARVDLLIEIDNRRFVINSVVNVEEGKKNFLKFNLSEKK